MLDEACAHAQAEASVSPELERLIRERRKVEAMIRRGQTHEAEPPGDVMIELGPMLDRILDEIGEMLVGRRQAENDRDGQGGEPGPYPSAPVRPRPSLSDRRSELDRLLRLELERQGIVVSGRDVARVVGAAVGKAIEWAG